MLQGLLQALSAEVMTCMQSEQHHFPHNIAFDALHLTVIDYVTSCWCAHICAHVRRQTCGSTIHHVDNSCTGATVQTQTSCSQHGSFSKDVQPRLINIKQSCLLSSFTVILSNPSVDSDGFKVKRCPANSRGAYRRFDGVLTTGSGARPDTNVQAYRTSHLLLQLLDACQPA